jgi:hypothetical protein
MLSDRDILDEFKQRIAGHFSASSSQLGDMQPQVGAALTAAQPQGKNV